jgi:hypothetical protein
MIPYSIWLVALEHLADIWLQRQEPYVKRHVVPQGVPDQNILQKSMADLTLTLSTASSYPPPC